MNDPPVVLCRRGRVSRPSLTEDRNPKAERHCEPVRTLAWQSASPDIRSLVRIKLHTGRSHQIRVQFSSRGFPLVGDHKYGSRAEETAPMLYSCALTFPHKGQTHQFESLPTWGK